MELQRRIDEANKDLETLLSKYSLAINLSLKYTPQGIFPIAEFIEKNMDNTTPALPSDVNMESSPVNETPTEASAETNEATPSEPIAP